MNIIEKLEAIIKRNLADACGAIEDVVSINDLRAIIEEYKATEQKPVGIIVLSSADAEYEMRMNFYPSAIQQGLVNIGDQVFTHSQPSDETVKDAERYKWLVKNRFLNGVDLKADGTSHFMARGLIGRARSLKEAIDEAMKAKS